MPDHPREHLDDDLVQRSLDGDLSPEELIRFGDHLQVCSQCARSVSDLRSAVSALEALPDVPIRRDLSQAVLAELHLRQMHPRRSLRLEALAVIEALAAMAILAWLGPQALGFLLDLLPSPTAADVLSLLTHALDSVRFALPSPEDIFGPIHDLRTALDGLTLEVGQAAALMGFAALAWLAGNLIAFRRLGRNHTTDPRR